MVRDKRLLPTHNNMNTRYTVILLMVCASFRIFFKENYYILCITVLYFLFIKLMGIGPAKYTFN